MRVNTSLVDSTAIGDYIPALLGRLKKVLEAPTERGGGVRVLVGYGSPILALAYQLRVTDRPNAIAL